MTSAAASRCFGDGLVRALIDQYAEFTIESRTALLQRREVGGDSFIVSSGCTGTRFRCKVTDHGDGFYTVAYKPTVSGACKVSVSLLGEPLPGSPFTCMVSAPVPHAPECLVKIESRESPESAESAIVPTPSPGEDSWTICSHKPAQLQVNFRNVFGQPTHAVELDMYAQRAEPTAGASPHSKGGNKSPLGLVRGGNFDRVRSPRGESRSIHSPRKGGAAEKSLVPPTTPFIMVNGAVIHPEESERGGKSSGGATGSPLRLELGTILRENGGELPGVGAELLQSMNEHEFVVVGNKPLLVTQSKACDSHQIGHLMPGHVLKLIRFAVMPHVVLPEPESAPAPAPPLPPGWVDVADPDGSGDDYYWNQATGETTWDRPYGSVNILEAVPEVADVDAPAAALEEAPAREAAAPEAAEPPLPPPPPPRSLSTPLPPAPPTASPGAAGMQPAGGSWLFGGSSWLGAAPAPAPDAAPTMVLRACVLLDDDVPQLQEESWRGLYPAEQDWRSLQCRVVKDDVEEAMAIARRELAELPPLAKKSWLKPSVGTDAASSSSASTTSRPTTRRTARSTRSTGSKGVARSKVKTYREHLKTISAAPGPASAPASVPASAPASARAITPADAPAQATGAPAPAPGVADVADASECVALEGTTAVEAGNGAPASKGSPKKEGGKKDAEGVEGGKATTAASPPKGDAKKRIKDPTKRKAQLEKERLEREEAERIAAEERAAEEALLAAETKIRDSATLIQSHQRGATSRRRVAAYRKQLVMEAEAEAARVAQLEAMKADAQLSRALARTALERNMVPLTPNVKLNLGRHKQPGFGWVTISMAEEDHLIQKRMGALPAHVRRQQMATWQRRFAIDSERERERAAVRDEEVEGLRRSELARARHAVAAKLPAEGELATADAASGTKSVDARAPKDTEATKDKERDLGGTGKQAAESGIRPTLADETAKASGPEAAGKSDRALKSAFKAAMPFGLVPKLPRACYLEELEADPTGIGFAYGGITPEPYGHKLHRAKPVDEHQVHFSVGQSGTYLLHVGLRQAAMPLPGSPFLVHVCPGPAHPLSSILPPAELPLRGYIQGSPPLAGKGKDNQSIKADRISVEDMNQSFTMARPVVAMSNSRSALKGKEPVEETPSKDDLKYESCLFKLLSRDKMGNLCAAGGASVTCGVLGHEEQPPAGTDADEEPLPSTSTYRSEVEDKGDGSYLLRWWLTEAGAYDVFIKVDGLHVLGSPTQMVIEADKAAFDQAAERRRRAGGVGKREDEEAALAAQGAAEIAARESALNAARQAEQDAREAEARRAFEEKIEANRLHVLKLKEEADAQRAKEEKLAALKADEEKRALARKEAMEKTKKMKEAKTKGRRNTKD